MKSTKKKKNKLPMSLTKKIVLTLLAAAGVFAVAYLLYYIVHYMMYDEYKEYLTSYEYEQGTVYTPVAEAKSDVAGMELVCENEYLKLYTNTKTAEIAVYDKRDGSVTYSNPQNADEDSVANAVNKNYLKSQMLVYYYNADVKSGVYDTYKSSVLKGQYSVEAIQNGVRYIYLVGDKKGDGSAADIAFEVPLEYRLEGDSLKVSIPTSAIKEYGTGSIYRIQLLRYMGAAGNTEDGYMVVPNGSGSLINFNNGKVTLPSYSQYVYDIDPLVATYTTLENVKGAKLPIFGICREDRSLLVSIEDGDALALISAGISGVYNDYNYAYPTFVLRNADNLRSFGDSTLDVFVLENDLYNANLTVRYSFLNEENKGYAGLAGYYREKLIADGTLTRIEEKSDIPLYYDIIAGVKETDHFLGVQYLHQFSMTDFDEAGQIAEDLKASGVNNQVMNLQGWFNGGYYHDAPHNMKITHKLGGRSGLEKLQERVTAVGGRMYVDTSFQRVTFADDGFNYQAEGARYFGPGYVAGVGQTNPATLRNTSGLGYMETLYDLLSPRYLPRYVGKFADKAEKLDVDGISLRDLGNDLWSDKKRTHIINREEALDVVKGQLGVLEETGKKLMTNAGNAYSFAYSSDIINVPVEGNKFFIVDESIPLYQMILHGCISYSTELLNFEDKDSLHNVLLHAVEAGASPHYVFTWEASSKMKDTGLSRYYATTYANHKNDALAAYSMVNDALKYVTNATVTDHVIFDNGVRKVVYDNGVTIYINYSEEDMQADGITIPAESYRLEGN